MPPEPLSTGLVPTAGVPGAVLQEKAALLRPMRDGSRWIYRYQGFNGSAPDRVELVQTAIGGITFRESDPLDPESAIDIYVDSQGTVRFVGALRVTATASPVAITGVELRSPVRANDQIVMIDQRIGQTGLDVDRDGKIDPADVAVWRTVVGNEPVTLPFRSEPMMAVRIDTTSVIRVVPSGGAAAQTVTSKISSWYAPSLGLVRETEAGTGGGRALDSDQTLLGYDGYDEGYGYTTTSTGVSWAMGRMPITSVLKMPQGVLLGVEGGLRLIDNYGRPKAMYLFDKGNRVGQTGSQFWVMGATPLGNDRTRYDLYGLDAAGKPEATAYASFDPLDQVPANVFIDTPRIAMWPGSAVFWVYWHDNRSPGLTQDTAFLRRHNGTTWVGDPIQIPMGADVGWPNALALPGALMLTWVERGTVQHTVRIGTDGTVSPQQLVNLAPSGSLDAGAWSLFSDSADQWAFWWGPTAGTDNGPHGARLDANGALLVTGADAASLRGAVLPSFQDLTGPLDPSLLGGYIGNWVYADVRFDVVYPDQTTKRNHLVVKQIKAGTSSPASSMTTAATYHIPDLTMVGPPIVFDRHTLLLTGNGTVMVPVVIWHR